MKVFWHNQKNGQAYHRAETPYKFIKEPLAQVGIELTLDVGFNSVKDYDAFIISRLPTESFMPHLETIKKMGKKIIYETDDMVKHLPKWNPAKQAYTPEAIKRVTWCENNAHHIIASTSYLALEINKPEKTSVLPNLIDLDLWNFKQEPHEGIRVVFQGSAFHSADLDMIAQALERTASEPNVMVIFMGDMPSSMIEWVRIFGQPYAEMIPHSRYSNKVGFVKPVDIHDFPKTLSSLSPDVGLAPLADYRFSRSKSNLKYLEYSMAGAYTVAQNYPPYENCKCRLASSHWYLHIMESIYNQNRPRLAQEAKQDVIDNHSWQNKSHIWIDAFKQIFSK